MKKLITILLVSFAMFFSQAHAASDLTSYIGFQFGASEANDDDDDVEFDINYGLIRLGIMPTENTAVEYRIGTGNSDDEVDGVTFELENLYGVYGLYYFDFSDNASLYGAAGFSYASFKGSDGVTSDQDDERGISFGIGAELFGFNAEFMQYLYTSELEYAAVAVGYNYRFD